MNEKFSAFSFTMRVFQAQSLLGVVSMTLPTDQPYDMLRQKLYEASMAILEVQNCLNYYFGENPVGKEE